MHFFCAGPVTSGGMGQELWGLSLAILSPSLFLSCDRYDKGLTAPNLPLLLGVATFNFPPLLGSPAQALAWQVQPVKMLAELICSSSTTVLCEKISGACKMSTFLRCSWNGYQRYLEQRYTRGHAFEECLSEYNQSSVAEAFLFDQSIDVAWLVCLWAGRDGKCYLFQ